MRTDRLGFIRPLYRRFTAFRAIRRNVTYGSNFRVGMGSFINAADDLVIGDDVSIGLRCWISCNGSIGDGALIASHVAIVSRYEHATEEIGVSMVEAATLGEPRSRPRDARDSITIGPDTWIGFGAILLSGIEIGRGAVIAAGSVVTHDVAPYAVVAGNPARVVSERMKAADRELHETLLRRRRV